MIKLIKEAESYGWEVDDWKAQGAYEMFCDYIGKEEANEAIVGCLGNEELAACLAYLFRMYEFHEWEESQGESDDEEEEFDEGCGRKVRRNSRSKLTEKSNFDDTQKAIDYYYPKWYYDDMSVNDIYDKLEKLGHSQDFIDAVIDGITDKYENEEDYELDDYDECLDEANVVGMNNLSNIEIYNAKSTARSYISQGYDPDYDLDIITKNLKNEGRSSEYIELVLTKMRNFKNKEFSYRIDYYGSWDNGHVLHSFKKATLDRAEEDAKKASIKDPKNLYYVVLDDIMDPTTGWYYYKGKAYSYSDPELDSIKRTINNSKDDFDV